MDSAPPPGAITASSLPVSVADAPQSAALRTAPRLALVIGNERYSNWRSLRLPGADARAMAQTLGARGFTLIGGGAQIDVSSAKFQQLLDATEAAIRANPGAIVAVYFAGHGFADQGHNYLAPSDAPDPARAISVSPAVGDIARRLNAAGSALTVMFLDACREYEPGRGGGLVEEPVPDNTFIGFATLFGTVALEPNAATAGHSYYTAALLRDLDSNTGNLDDLHLSVAQDVVLATQARQAPVYRHGVRMPTAPIRLAVNDPQTAYSVAMRHDAARADELAARCAAMSDLRLIISFSSSNPMAGRIEIGPRFEPVDLTLTENSCRSAVAAGHRNAAILRGLAIAELLALTRPGESPTKSVSANAYALLAEAAEAGDVLSNFAIAMAQSSPELEMPMEVVPDRLLRAAEQNQPPITGMVGLLLWHPEGVELRSRIGLPRAPERGLRLFQRAVVSGDPLLQPLAMSMRLKNDPAVANLDLRGGLRRALGSDSAVGFEFEGFSVRQTLYLFALADAVGGVLGPKDPREAVRLTLEAEPFLAKLGQAYVRNTGRLNVADGFLTTAACILASGRDQSGAPVPGISPNKAIALRLVQQTSDNPPPELRRSIDQLRRGGTCE
jgi:hypothetical protein